MNMPPGYRFLPTDLELVQYYLINRIINRQNPFHEINEVKLYDHDPRTLAEMHSNLGGKWYFFTGRKRKYPNGDRPSRRAGDGYWKATGADKPVRGGDGDGGVVGSKKTLVYYRDTINPKGSVKTDWIMHEFKVDEPPRVQTNPTDMTLDECVLCRIYKKEAKKVKVVVGERAEDEQQHHQGSGSYEDFIFMEDWDSISFSSLLQDNSAPISLDMDWAINPNPN